LKNKNLQPPSKPETFALFSVSLKRSLLLFLIAGTTLTQGLAQDAAIATTPAPRGAGPPTATTSEPSPPPRTEAELDPLLAHVALHPDPLLAQILPAATQPTDIVLAARYLNDKKYIAKIDAQP